MKPEKSIVVTDMDEMIKRQKKEEEMSFRDPGIYTEKVQRKKNEFGNVSDKQKPHGL